MKTKPQSRISRITVSRLYNLGNYENCSYSLTVDIPEGQSAARAVRGIERILQGLRPMRDVLSPHAAKLKRDGIKRMRELTDEQFARQYGDPAGGRRAYTRRCWADLKEEIAKSQRQQAIAKKARDLFDDLGGAEKWKDAKLDWDDEW